MLELKLAKNKMENEEGMNHLLVKVKPMEAIRQSTKPVAFVLLVDVSGSMDGSVCRQNNGYNNLFDSYKHNESNSKLGYVKQAGDKLVDMLSDGDMLGVVSFADTASLEYPITAIDQQARFQLKDRIRLLKTRGATNISEGLETGFQQVVGGLKETHHVKMILLSDGQANYGVTDTDGIATLANKYRQNDVSVTTIGVGEDYNSFYMETVATASGGTFHHLKEMEQLNDILESELRSMKALTTQKVMLQIKVDEGITLEENMNGFAEDERGKVYLGNLFSEQSVLIELNTNEAIEPGSYKISVQMNCFDQNNVMKEAEHTINLDVVVEDDMAGYMSDEQVVGYVKAMMEAKASKEAVRNYETGDINGATANINASMLKMQSLSEQYGTNMMDSFASLDQLEKSIATGSLSAMESKTLYSASYKKTRNQSDDSK